MKRNSTIGGVVLFYFVSVLAVCISAEPTFEERANQCFQGVTKGETTGLAVLVARDGKIVYQGGFGFADLESKTPVTPETKFRIGSISKQFTAAAVLRLAEQGKLSLSDSLTKFFADYPGGDNVTIRHLMTHTSGLHSYTEKPDFIGRVTKGIEPGKLIEYFRNDPPDFAPGKGFHYNNSAYFLLGEIVAKVSEKPFADFLRESLFEPLGMKDTGIFVNATPPSGMALGYSFSDGKVTPALDWDMSWAGGAGALYSTVGDLFLWNEALFGGRVVNDESFKAATTPVDLPPDVDGMNYGYGLMMYDVRRLPAIGHGGGLNGWSTNLVRLTKQNCTVVVLTNSLPSTPSHSPNGISNAIAQIYLADEIKQLPPLVEDSSIDPESFNEYAGRYEYPNAVMTVTVEDKAIFARLTGQEKMQIFPSAKDEFFWKSVDAQIKFLRNSKGEVASARHSQNGNTMRVKKLPADAIQLTDEQVEQFVGQYQYGPGVVMTVTREDTQLFAQLTGQPRNAIFPKSDSEFEWRVVAASVEFVKDDDGKISKAVHHQNGGTINAPKVK